MKNSDHNSPFSDGDFFGSHAPSPSSHLSPDLFESNEDYLAREARYQAEAQGRERQVQHGKRKKKIIGGGVVAGLAMSVGGASLALKGGSEDAAASPDRPPAVAEAPTTTINSTDEDGEWTPVSVPQTTEVTAPTETQPVVTVPTPSTTEQANTTSTTEVLPEVVKPVSPFERTGDPEKDAILGWFETASNASAVEVSSTELKIEAPVDQIVKGAERAESFLQEAGAHFEVAFRHPSGMLINVYLSDLNGLPNIEINPQSLSTLISYGLQHPESVNTGYLIPSEMEAMKAAEQTEAFASHQVNVIFVNGRDAEGNGLCAEDIKDVVGADNQVSTCEVAGFADPQATPENHSVSTIVVQLADIQPDLPPEVMNSFIEAGVSQVFAHEIAHIETNMVGADARYWAGKQDSALEATMAPNGVIDTAKYQEIIGLYDAEQDRLEHEQYVYQVGGHYRDIVQFNTQEVSIPQGKNEYGIELFRVYTVGRQPFLAPPVDVKT